MKRIFILILFFLNIMVAGMAQDSGEKPDGGRLQAYKIAFLTKKINLSPEEAQRFWPVYNQYEKELRTARMDNRQKKGDEIELEEKVLNIRKKYHTEFIKVLSAEKVNNLFRAEKEFGNMVQRELLERKRQKNDNRKK